jgi:hypothetical protein
MSVTDISIEHPNYGNVMHSALKSGAVLEGRNMIYNNRYFYYSSNDGMCIMSCVISANEMITTELIKQRGIKYAEKSFTWFLYQAKILLGGLKIADL